MRPVPANGQLPQGARRYRVTREGIDNDGDGRFNEDGIGGIDMNRNFPRNWEREHLQGGAGEFPLSEPETYAAVRFIQDHPKAVYICSMVDRPASVSLFRRCVLKVRKAFLILCLNSSKKVIFTKMCYPEICYS